MRVNWLGLAGWVVLCYSVAAIGGRWTAPEIGSWYRRLRRPSFAPPNWVFGPVWTLLYGLMAVAAWRVSEAPGAQLREVAIGLFLAQLGLNLGWSWIFFKRHAMGAALAELAVLWATIGATVAAFSGVDRIAAWLMVPYWAWVSFATALNAGFWRLNRRGPEPAGGLRAGS